VLTAVPQILIQQVTANLVIAEGFDELSVQTEVSDAILEYINNLGISGDVLRNRLIEIIMSVSGVTNTTLTLPAIDVIILDDQLPRTTAGNVTLT
jgi:phage-related baseplate assembly protein